MYWYHSHRHTLTAQQTYLGLAGLLVDRTPRRQPSAGHRERRSRSAPWRSSTTTSSIAQGGQAILNDPNWPQYVSTLDPPEGSRARGRHLRADADAAQLLAVGSRAPQFFTVWWAGPLTIDNHRGQLQFVPSNLQSFTSDDGRPKVAGESRRCRITCATCSSPINGQLPAGAARQAGPDRDLGARQRERLRLRDA